MTREARFAAAMTAVARALQALFAALGLPWVVAPSVIGYLVINLCTFFLDLLLLALFHGVLRLPLPVSVTLSYGSAGVVSYVANRVLNFRSHGAVGRQLVWFIAAELSNYFIFVLGLTDGLAAAGVYFELARVIAACCEGVFLYCCMRWLVFRDTLGRPGDASAHGAAPVPAETAVPAEAAASDETPAPDEVGSVAPGETLRRPR